MVDSTSQVYDDLVRNLPQEISRFLNRSDFSVVGSMGKGNRTSHPWISILNKHITISTQEGLYVVYLFKSDMSGFYLTLNQGITNFKNLFDKNMYIYARKAVKYFQDELVNFHNFSTNRINLVSKTNSLGYGYEQTTILSKFYSKDSLDEMELKNDLTKMIGIYDYIYQHISQTSYNQVINSIVSNNNPYQINADKASMLINETLTSESNYPRNMNKKLIKVKETGRKSPRFKKITQPQNTKIDYIKKAAHDLLTGLEGEQLVIEYEKEKLINLGYEYLANKVKWIANQTDVAGYDILSYEIDNNQNIKEIYIEVKTSTSKIDSVFYVSANELSVSKEKGDQYRLFRIFDILSFNPKYYIAGGKLEENFILDPVTFAATYKYSVEE